MAEYLEVSEAAGRSFVLRGITGPVVMLNLLRFRDVADYSAAPDLAPDHPITGAEAYQRYTDETAPFLAASGGKVLFAGTGGPWLIGPGDETWDYALLVEQASVDSFLAYAQNPDYLRILGHRTAALRDSRLLPLESATP